jgi:parvulin-like peptidyl-prolyl isomerase
MHGITKLAVVVALILASLSGCRKDAPEGAILAEVNDAVLTLEEFHSEIPVEYVMGLTPDQKMGFVDRWINTELVYQEALRQGLDKEESIAARLAQVQRELLANEFLQRELSAKANIRNEDVRRYFTEHEAEFNIEIKIAHILLADPDTAAALLSSLKEGADFTEAAKTYSLDQSGQTGGVVADYIRRGDMGSLPELEDAAFALEKPGQLSGVVQSEYGYHIVKLVARRKLPSPAKFEDVSDRIRDGLVMTMQKTVFEELIADLKSRADVEVHPELLKPFSKDPTDQPQGNR